MRLSSLRFRAWAASEEGSKVAEGHHQRQLQRQRREEAVVLAVRILPPPVLLGFSSPPPQPQLTASPMAAADRFVSPQLTSPATASKS